MARNTGIQWCTDTVNPNMGCSGCELFPPAGLILARLDERLSRFGISSGFARDVLQQLIAASWGNLPADADRSLFSPELTTTNIWHHRRLLELHVAAIYGNAAGEEAVNVIEESIKCYAAKLHLNKGTSLVNPTRQANTGYAPYFEKMTPFPGRIAEAARWSDMCGIAVPDKPWLSGLPRLIFVSDMGDMFAKREHFNFLEQHMMTPIRSEQGMRHLWLMLTKRPGIMAEFGHRIGGFPENVCAMTTVTGPNTLGRVRHLQQVSAPVRGLSIEPVLHLFDPESLDLNGIHWVILGGESGKLDLVTPFDLDWLRQMVAHCSRSGAAVFVKQLGRKPVLNGDVLRLGDPHGGDWEEWPVDLRVREFPRYFHEYRNPHQIAA
jgi:protein gp37